MRPWVLLDSTSIPGKGGELRLFQRGDEFSIRIFGRGGELMNSRKHGSEDALAELTCARLKDGSNPRLLIGGLGMGFTLAAALQHAGNNAQVEVAELIPAVVEWNQGPLGEHAGYPVQDSRVVIHEGDVACIIKSEQEAYNAIMLDVDNGPEGFTQKNNNWLYSMDGLISSYEALRPNGILAVWSAGPANDFLRRLRKVGFEVEEKRVYAHGNKGTQHVIWFAKRH